MGPNPPDKMTRKPTWLAKIINGIRAYAISSHIESILISKATDDNQTVSAELHPTKTGTLMKLVVGGGQRPHPFHASVVPVNGSSAIRITKGRVNGYLPSGMNVQDKPHFTISPSGSSGSVWLQVSLVMGTGTINTVSISSGSNVPADDSDAGNYYLPIAAWFRLNSNGDFDASGTLYVEDNLTGSQTFQRCRDWFSYPTTYSATWSVI